MGLLDKAKKLAKGKEDQIIDGVDKATDMIDDKTGGKHTDKLDKVDDLVKDQLDDK